METFKKYLVTLSPQGKENKEAALAELTEAGLKVEKVYPFGVITGNTTNDRVNLINSLDSVLSISEEKTIRLPGKGEKVQ
jgi:hypothetical protein